MSYQARPSREVLESARLRLDPLGPQHAEALWRASAASLPELRPWLFWARNSDLASTLAFAQASRRAWEQGTDWVFAIVHEGVGTGTIGLHHYDAVLARAELGYWLASDLTGRGLMTEAGSAVVRFGFEVLGLHRIQLVAAPANEASVRVAEKLGFTREGLLRDGSRGAQGWHDAYLFGLLATDPTGVPGG